MKSMLMLTGDVNLMNVTDPEVPFARIVDTLRRADVLFGNQSLSGLTGGRLR